MMLSDLTPEERLALGGLLRLIIRADRSFSEEEETQIDTIGDELGGREELWKAISSSAQSFRDEAAIHAAALRVTRPEVRELILEVMAGLAAADSISPNEMSLIDALRKEWGVA